MNNIPLDGKNAVVTGAGRGLGRAFAHTLADAGANVAIADIIPENAENVCTEIRAKGRRSVAIHADISKTEDAGRMVQETVAALGRLDICVNNAGVALPIKFAQEIQAHEWDWLMNINLKGTFFCAQAAARVMIPNRSGKIILIGSICGHIVWPEPQSVYSISKAGVLHMTKCLAAEYIKHGIQVNCISPGVTRVENLFPEVIPIYLKTAPVDRIGEVKDLQGAMLYLATSASDFMVGQELIVDGGYTIM